MSVLSAMTIKERVERGEIIRGDTFEERQLWAGKYNLRIGDDGMIVPLGRGDQRGFHKILPGAAERLAADGFSLEPGETAFVSTWERFNMPWDVSGIVGPKFTLARHGLLVLTGSVVDPGFGASASDDGPLDNDERLHFLVANLGSKPYTLVPGDSIASVMFFELDRSVEGEPQQRPVTSTLEVRSEFYRGDAIETAGLAFIGELENMRDEVRRLEEELTTLKSRDVENLRITVETLQNSTHQLIFFGVFLLAVTLLAACFTLAVGFWRTTHLTWWQGATSLAATAAVLWIALRWVNGAADRMARSGRDERSSPEETKGSK